ncbi:hypothetical protein [Flavobacterium acetivorans]|uniref:hypothetical protein n=1 Tax=Flavobacterium acetivorans TaxID=2893883 RepID=UPI001E29961B|nr:hypothetical protein [Flavobacterium sp. F-29]UFH34664.1 hypothetical protein LNP19_11260 [Flavobacterium sp. F-29]
MKIKLIIIGLAISLMSTKCAEKPVYFSFENKSEKDVFFSYTKNIDSLKKIIYENSYHDSRFKYLHKHTIKKDTLIGSDLYFYLSKNKNFYTFYFFRVLKYDSKKNDFVFGDKYDSINISRNKIRIGEGGRNSFLYGTHKIIFKSKELD